MADRYFQKKNRNEIRRHRKPMMLITAEGKNKTEKLYFDSFNEQHGKYRIYFVNSGGDTDPEGMLKSINKAWANNELSTEYGDKAYIVLDMDCLNDKINLVKKLQRTTKNVRFIASNPCIEVWFIFHYVYTTHQFKDSKEPKNELAKYIAGYEESMDISTIIRPLLEEAKKNVERLTAHYESIGTKWGDIDCNPMTDVLEIINELEV